MVLNLSGCTNFWLEGNVVRTTTPTSADIFGIVVNETAGSPEVVYRNTVNPMNYRIQANGLNYNPLNNKIGLEFICNDLSSTWYTGSDISIGSLKGIAGVAIQQAVPYPSTTTPLASAGNKFGLKYTPAFHFYNLSTAIGISYLWHNSGENPYLTNHVFVTSYNAAENICSDNTTCCNISVDATTSIPPQVFISKDIFLSKKHDLEVAIDNSNSDDYPMLLVRYKMLIDTMIRTYLFAADSLVQFKGDSSFIVYNIDTLSDTVNQVNYYDTTIVYTDSSVPLNYDKIIWVLDSARYLYQFKIELAAVYRHIRDFSSAIDVLNNITNNYSLNDTELTDLNNIIYLYKMEDSLYHKNNRFDSLSSTDTTLIGSIARDSAGKARYIAQGLLSMFNNTYFWPDVNIIPDTSNKPSKPNIKSLNSVRISPNPADDKLTITDAEQMNISIYNSNGKVVYYSLINCSSFYIDVAQQPNGIYLVKLMKEGKPTEIQEISIRHRK